MCFTVNINIVKEELERRYEREFIDPENYRPSYYYHAFSLPYLPVVTPASIETMQWGLIPHWVSGSDEADELRLKTFNARSETIDSKPAFASSFASSRCIIPVNGFFEWQHRGKERIPWYIYASDKNIFSLGGIWSEWHDIVQNTVVKTFSIVTTEANTLLADIHNSGKRMPLILTENDTEVWLKGETAQIRPLMKPAGDGLLKAHTISPLIKSKSAMKNSPDIIKPYLYYITGTLFD
jgi:putative SOS response-associated peptidase YedK